MPIPVSCPACQKKFSAPDSAAGRVGKCPACKGEIRIPAPAPAAAEDSLSDLINEALDSSPPPAKPASRPADDYTLAPPAETPAPTRVWTPSSPFAGRTTSGSAPDRPIPAPLAASAGGPGWQDKLYWLWLLALVPLVVMTLFPAQSAGERIDAYFQEHPEALEKMKVQAQQASEDMDLDTLILSALPEGRIPGSHVGRESLIHWAYALISAGVFCLLILLMFPRYDVSWWLPVVLAVGVGTVGILILLAFQYIALATSGGGFRVRGGVGLIIYAILFFIGWSYRCALQPDSNFFVSFFGFTCGVGLCEEFIKALPIWMFMKANPLADWRSGVVVGLACGVGFGVSEGVSYSADHYNGMATGMIYLVRFVSCVALHAIWSGAVAMLMFGEKAQHEEHEGVASIAVSIVKFVLLSMILHGLYDTLLKHDQGLAALAVAIVSFGWFAWLISVREADSPQPALKPNWR